MSAWFLALATLAVQDDPDLSTPDRALVAFMKFLRETNNDYLYWHDRARESDRASDPIRSASFRKRTAKGWEANRVSAEQTGFLWGERVDVDPDTSPRSEHRAMFAIKQQLFAPSYDAEKDVWTRMELGEPFVVKFVRMAGKWLVEEFKKVCPICKGTGRTEHRINRTTVELRTCATCKGDIFIQDSLSHHTLLSHSGLYVAEEKFSPSTDTMSARGAVKAYMDSWIDREIRSTRGILEWIDRRLAVFKKFLTPTLAARADGVLKIDVDLGKKRYRELRHEILSVQERKDGVYAEVQWTILGAPGKVCLRMIREEGRWLVAAELSEGCGGCASTGKCPMCKGGGRCSTCNGSGKLEEVDCTFCTGRGACSFCEDGGCRQCRGVRWKDPTQCPSCAGSGRCSDCKGSGTCFVCRGEGNLSGFDCSNCSAKGTCASCAGGACKECRGAGRKE